MTTSSSYYPRSNRLAKKFVGIVKKIIIKFFVDKTDLQLLTESTLEF